MPNQFEQFIKDLLDQANAADALRDITERNLIQGDSSLETKVDNFLLEYQLESQFNPAGYSDDAKRISILNRVQQLKDLLDRNLIDREHPHYISVQICLKYIYDGYALNKYALEYLNQIYKNYA
jgi:hypothetical protein